MDGPLMLNVHAVAKLANVCPRTIRRAVKIDKFPAPVRVGRRTQRWQRDVVLAFLGLLPLVAEVAK